MVKVPFPIDLMDHFCAFSQSSPSSLLHSRCTIYISKRVINNSSIYNNANRTLAAQHIDMVCKQNRTKKSANHKSYCCWPFNIDAIHAFTAGHRVLFPSQDSEAAAAAKSNYLCHLYRTNSSSGIGRHRKKGPFPTFYSRHCEILLRLTPLSHRFE